MDKKRKSLELSTKLKIIQECENASVSRSEIGRRYGLTPSTLFTILKNKDKIQSAAVKDCAPGKTKKLRAAKHIDLEEALFTWFSQNRARGIPVDGAMLKAKAVQLALQLNIDDEDFKCSDGWLNRFKARKGISLHKISGESESVNKEAVNSWQPILASILDRYKPSDVYNADESGLFYNLLPDRTLAVRNDPCKGGKRSKERLTVLLCANMDGSDKLKPYVIGKSKNPRAFKGARAIPCFYEANKKAWMTSQLFKQWLHSFDARMGVKNRKVVLFVDRCPAHPDIKLHNVELVFLPANCTSVLQPLDQGVFNLLKREFRKQLVNAVMRKLAAGKTMCKWNVLEAIRALAVSWENITPEVIAACFRHAGFRNNPDDDATSLEDALPDSSADEPSVWPSVAEQLNVSCTFEEFVTVDKNVDVCGEMTDAELVDLVTNQDDAASEEDDDQSDDVAVPTQASVMEALDIISSFYQHKNASTQDMMHFQAVQSFVLSESIVKAKQTKIDSFFKKKE